MSLPWNKEASVALSSLQDPHYVRKSVYNVYKKRFQPIRRANMQHTSPKLPYFPSVQSEWIGDSMNKNPKKGRLRFWVQNCNGLKLSDNSNINHNFTQLNEFGIHFCSFTETNLNVSNPHSVSKLFRIHRGRYPTGRMAITNTPGYPKTSHFQPGGVFSCFDASLHTRFISSEQDKHGRWHCQTFRGRERDLKVYTLYRVHRRSDDSARMTTAWMQQRDSLRREDVFTNPRDDVIQSLLQNIKKDVDSHKSIILTGDFNEAIDSKEGTHNKLEELGLVNLMEKRISTPLPKTWNRGKTAIDHTYMSIDVFKSVKKAGFSPFNIVALSDHRGMFFDLDMSLLFDEVLHNTVPAHFRRLQSSIIKRVKAYNKKLKHQWDHHKIDEKLASIIRAINAEGPTPALIKRLNNLDSQISDIMKSSEKQCTNISRHCIDPWSPRLKELARKIRYLLVHIKNTLRDVLPVSLVECMTKVNELNKQLVATRKEYREFIKKHLRIGPSTSMKEHNIMSILEKIRRYLVR